MNRRDAVHALLALGVTPITSSIAQQAQKVWRIGFLHLSTHSDVAPALDAFRQAFRDLGYLEGRDYVLEARFADNEASRLQNLAAELVRSRPDVIMVHTTTPTLAVKKATTTIPIVMISVGDPVGSGLVKSFARPGDNVTGTSNSLTDIAPKHLELLHEMLPKVSRVAVLMNPNYLAHRNYLTTIQALALRIGVSILPIEVRSAQEIENGFVLMAKQSAGATIVLPDSIHFERRRQIAELAVSGKLPCSGLAPEYADGDFLIGYGTNRLHLYRRTAYFVDKILKGAKPGDLPVELPTKLELVINLKTASALGLTVPKLILLRADRVIE